MSEIERLQIRVRAFAEARAWGQFHSPKNLAMALAAEAGELLEVFQWLTEDQSRTVSPAQLERAREELADVAIYLLRLTDELGVSLPDAISAKLLINESKYPVARSYGNATKYDEREP